MQNGVYGSISWNAQLAQRIHNSKHTLPCIEFGKALYMIAMAPEHDTSSQRDLQNVGKRVALALAPALLAMQSTKDTATSDDWVLFVPITKNGFSKACALLWTLTLKTVHLLQNQPRETDTLEPPYDWIAYLRTRQRCVSAMTSGFASVVEEHLLGETLSQSSIANSDQERSDWAYSYPSSEDVIVLVGQTRNAYASDPILSEWVKQLSVPRRPLNTSLSQAHARLLHAEQHLDSCSIRNSVRVSSIYATETSSVAYLLDATCIFLRTLHRDRTHEERRVPGEEDATTLPVAATTSSIEIDVDIVMDALEKDSWVLDGACSNAAMAINGLVACYGQRPSSLLYWRCIGWRTTDTDVSTLCARLLKRIHSDSAAMSDQHEMPRDVAQLIRLGALCLHAQTRASLIFLNAKVSSFHWTRLRAAAKRPLHEAHSYGDTLCALCFASWQWDLWPRQYCPPMACLFRRLGGTISMSYSTSYARCGLQQSVIDSTEQSELYYIDHETAKPSPHSNDSMGLEDDSTDDGAVYNTFVETLAAACDVLRDAKRTQSFTCAAMERFSNHDYAFVIKMLAHSIERVSESMRVASMATPTDPPSRVGEDVLTFGRVYADAFNAPVLPRLSQLTSAVCMTEQATLEHIQRAMQDPMASNRVSRILHRAGQHTANLLEEAARVTAVRSDRCAKPVSITDQTRHVALLWFGCPLGVQLGDLSESKPLVFARFISQATSVSYPVDSESDATQESTRDVFAPALLSQDDEAAVSMSHVPFDRLVASNMMVAMVGSNDHRMKAVAQERVRVANATDALYATASTSEFLSKVTGVDAEDVVHELGTMVQDAVVRINEWQSNLATPQGHTEAPEAHAHSARLASKSPEEAIELCDEVFADAQKRGLLKELGTLDPGKRQLLWQTPCLASEDKQEWLRRWLSTLDPRHMDVHCYDGLSQHVVDTIVKVSCSSKSQTMCIARCAVDAESALTPTLISWEALPQDMHAEIVDARALASHDEQLRLSRATNFVPSPLNAAPSMLQSTAEDVHKAHLNAPGWLAAQGRKQQGVLL